MKKDLKQQIKQDEFRSKLGTAFAWIRTHRDEARVTLVVLLVVAVGLTTLKYFQERRTIQAQRQLATAVETFHASVSVDPAEAAVPGAASTYPSAEEKFTKAAAAFDGVERRGGSKSLADRAKYYGALSRIELGKLEEAEKALAELAARREPNALEPALARMALARLHRQAGRIEQAVELYRQIVDDPESPLPRDHALLSLAQTLEAAQRPAEARASYQQLVDRFPASPYVGEARRKAAYLETAGRG